MSKTNKNLFIKIEKLSINCYVKINGKENAYGHAKGRNHWHGFGDV